MVPDTSWNSFRGHMQFFGGRRGVERTVCNGDKLLTRMAATYSAASDTI